MAGLVAFRKLFWVARKAHVKAGKNAGVDLPEHQAARAHAHEHGLVWGELLLNASLLICHGKPDEALSILLTVGKAIPETEGGIVSLLKGAALQEKGDYEAAEEAYKKAAQDQYGCRNVWLFASPNGAGGPVSDAELSGYRERIEDQNLSPGWDLWLRLGEALEKGEYYEEAAEAYQEALKDPTAEPRSPLLVLLGGCLHRLGDYEGAIKACREALEDSQFEQRGPAWFIIGCATVQMRKYAEAVEPLEHARKEFGKEAPDLLDYLLAYSYYRVGRSDNAEPLLEGLLGNKEGDMFLRSLARSHLSRIKSGINYENGSAEDRGYMEAVLRWLRRDDLEDRIFGKIGTAKKTQYEQYLNKPGSERDNVLAILRGWSSSVTLLEGSERRWRGGGYFIKWQGKGIVIDPGFDFLRNFHDKRYHGREIDAVLVSHNHSDHNADLKSIDDLLYELYKRKAEDSRSGVSPYLLLQDAGTEDLIKLDNHHAPHRYPPMLFDTTSCEQRHTIVPRENLPFSVEYFRVRHGDECKQPVGFTLILETSGTDSFRLGYTGDTEYFDDLAEYLKGCDLLLAHISQPDFEDFTDPRHRKKNHLGYRGLAELIKRSAPKLTIVSEFWAGFADLRIDLVMALRRLTGNPRIFPASIGMHVHLPNIEVECTACGQKSPYDKVGVAPSRNPFGELAYLCSHCMLEPPGEGEAVEASGFPRSRE